VLDKVHVVSCKVLQTDESSPSGTAQPSCSAATLGTSSLKRVLFFKQSIKAVHVAEQSSTVPFM
jgi:hypothetical protein